MPSPSKIEYFINPFRLLYLLDLFKLSKGELVTKLNITKNNEKRKTNLVDVEWLNRVLKKEEKINYPLLERLDYVFNVGISWLVSSRALPPKKGSIFFRKKTFNTELDFNSRKIVDQFEKRKIEIQLMSKYINYNPKRILKVYNTDDDSIKTSEEIASKFINTYNKLINDKLISRAIDERGYLKNTIRTMEEFNLFVFERTETWNQKERINIDGLFMGPNYILIKRNQQHFRREIFSLIHEFAHYLLNIEEIDNIKDEFSNKKLSKIEKWCNTFAFYFLLHDQKSEYDKIRLANKDNNYSKAIIDNIYKNTHLTYRAVYTRLVIEGKISKADYNKKTEELDNYIKEMEIEKKFKREKDKELGIKQGGSAPKPIESKLFTELVKINFFEGNIGENKLREYLNIKQGKDIRDVIY